MINNVLELVGGTPLVHIKMDQVIIGVKLESFNPGGSIKDRAVMKIIAQAEGNGLLYPGAKIVEATSGNTGVAVAMMAAAKGYRATIVTHDKASQEKLDAMRHYGAAVVVAHSRELPESRYHFIQIARRLANEGGGFLIDQFNNPLNPLAHFEKTGPEIWSQTDGKVTCVVCGMGSGGTISGIGKFLKSQNPAIRIVGADPYGSLYAAKFHSKPRGAITSWATEGVGSDFIPSVMDFSVIDEVVSFTDTQAHSTAMTLRQRFGVNVGPSAGAAFHVALNLNQTVRGECAVVIAPDGAERYFSKLNANVNAPSSIVETLVI